MDAGTERWLAPVVSAASVALLIAVMWRFSGGSGEAPLPHPVDPSPTAFDSDAALEPVPVPPSPPVVPAGDRARLVAYTAHGRVLSLRYALTVRSCNGRIGPPVVVESVEAVTVTVRRLQVPRRSAEGCPPISLVDSVDIRLSAALAGREVRDGGRDGVPVPQERG